MKRSCSCNCVVRNFFRVGLQSEGLMPAGSVDVKGGEVGRRSSVEGEGAGEDLKGGGGGGEGGGGAVVD